MKLLLDENIHRRVKQLLSDHEVYTVHEMGWSSQKNGALLRLMVEKEFDALITADKNMKHQQNFEQHKMAVVVLNVKGLALDHLLPLIPKLKEFFKKELKPGVSTIE